MYNQYMNISSTTHSVFQDSWAEGYLTDWLDKVKKQQQKQQLWYPVHYCDHLHPVPSVPCTSQETDLAGEHLLWLALSFGTRCQLLHMTPVPKRWTASNENSTGSCLNELKSCCRWQYLWVTAMDEGYGKDYNNISIAMSSSTDPSTPNVYLLYHHTAQLSAQKTQICITSDLSTGPLIRSSTFFLTFSAQHRNHAYKVYSISSLASSYHSVITEGRCGPEQSFPVRLFYRSFDRQRQPHEVSDPAYCSLSRTPQVHQEPQSTYQSVTSINTKSKHNHM